MAFLYGFFESPQDTHHLRLHRARSVCLTKDELIEMRAIQRTFEGAYTRTALSQFSFALIVLKIFSHEFYSVGALFAVFGTCIYAASLLRRREGNRAFFVDMGWAKMRSEGGSVGQNRSGSGGAGEEGTGQVQREGAEVDDWDGRMFRTSGNVVFLVTGMSVAAYVALLVLVLRLGDEY